MSDLTSKLSLRFKEASVIFLIGFALFLLLSIVTYHAADPSWSHASSQPAANAAGLFGAWISDVLLYAFGYVAYLFPLILIAMMLVRFKTLRAEEAEHHGYVWARIGGFFLVLFSFSALSDIFFHPLHSALPASVGGVIGSLFSQGLQSALNQTGATILLVVTTLSGLTLSLGISWGRVLHASLQGALKFVKSSLARSSNQTKSKQDTRAPAVSPFSDEAIHAVAAQPKPAKKSKVIDLEKVKAMVTKKSEKKAEKKIKKDITTYKPKKLKPTSSNTLIDLGVLNEPAPTQHQNLSTTDLEALSRLVEEKLLDFGIEVKVVGVHPGPVITRFELDLAAGIKVSRITTLSMDLARSLSAISVRVVEVIPGKAVVGLEIPNKHREVVYFKETLSSSEYQDAKSPVSLALGKDISGQPVVVDLAKMPHLLVAGTTGSGKSVGVNAMLLSILFKATPEEVRLILVDPKMLELSIYDGIPHLLTPVVTDMREAAQALRWCVAEMERRYRLLASQGVRSLDSYNQKVKAAIKEGKPIEAPDWYKGDDPKKTLESLPNIVVVVDEFADMMMVVGKKVEQLIARIAQKARAAGIHLILATQRPSVNVITGLIKANIPTRIAFQVSSRIDSRTILDQQGAQQLLGHGDMLYLAPGGGVPMRVHGAFVADDEVHKVVEEWKQYGEPEYLELGLDVAIEGFEGEEGEQDAEKDECYDQAVQIVIETRRASISSIQRRLKIGYNRAARLVESMEQAGLVGPMENNGTREILIPEQQ
jgi:S-DNA-T family DNA segregation ATPase FtsK/SpoIIIE